MFKIYKKAWLFELFGDRVRCTIYDGNGHAHSGVISSIQHEDGSGSSFNISLETGEKFHLRTID